MKFNLKKTVDLVFSRKRDTDIPPITMDNTIVTKENHPHKHLGLTLQSDGRWKVHIDETCMKAKRRMDIIRSYSQILDRKSIETMYLCYVRPILEYGAEIFDNCTQEEKQKLEDIQLEGARAATGAKRGTSHAELYEATQWETLQVRRTKKKLLQMFKIATGIAPTTLQDIVPIQCKERTNYNLRNKENLTTPSTRTESLKNSFVPATVKASNELPQEIKESDDDKKFKTALSKHLSTTTQVPSWHYTGKRRSQIMLNRIRLVNCDLNENLHSRNLAPSPSCSCGHPIENEKHYLMTCPLFNIQRQEMCQKLHML